jgi:glycosyltransferase involved in cell wall biosynthesis
MGVPAVVQPIGCVAERVVDGVTGTVVAEESEFGRAAVALLREDDLWSRFHIEALARQRGLGWHEVAARFEAQIAR